MILRASGVYLDYFPIFFLRLLTSIATWRRIDYAVPAGHKEPTHNNMADGGGWSTIESDEVRFPTAGEMSAHANRTFYNRACSHL
jgi:hypothetical protein